MQSETMNFTQKVKLKIWKSLKTNLYKDLEKSWVKYWKGSLCKVKIFSLHKVLKPWKLENLKKMKNAKWYELYTKVNCDNEKVLINPLKRACVN